MRRVLAGLLLSIVFSISQGAGLGKAQGNRFDLQATAKFGASIEIKGTLQTTQPLQKVFIFAQELGSPNTYTRQVKVIRLQDNNYRIEHFIEPTELSLRPFSTMEYHLEATLANGEVISSDPQRLVYEDDRFAWKMLEEFPYRVHWYEGSVQYAQEMLDIAQKGARRIQDLLGTIPPNNLDIYIYPSSADLQETLQLSGKDWVAGHADPDLGVIIISLPAGPDQQLLAEQRIPHESMHVQLYWLLGEGYQAQPAWLNEGLASIAELYPNPDYEILLDKAAENSKLIPLKYLCDQFPKVASNALIAYAEASSFTQFLIDHYGNAGLRGLLNQYSLGFNCENGAEKALGKKLSSLESDWQKDRFGQTPTEAALSRLLPWAAILAIVIVPLILLAVFRLRRKSQGK